MKAEYDFNKHAVTHGGVDAMPESATHAQIKAYVTALSEVNPAKIYEDIFDEPYPVESDETGNDEAVLLDPSA